MEHFRRTWPAATTWLEARPGTHALQRHCWLRLRRHRYGRPLDRGDRHERHLVICEACGQIGLRVPAAACGG